MLEDKLLIWKLRRGQGDALRVLYEKYKDDLRTMAGAMLGDKAAGEDVLHDVFVRFAENVRGLRIRTSLKRYLTTCVVNRVRDEFRRRSRQRIESDQVEAVDCDLDCPASRAENHETAQILTAALGEIPYEQREVITLHLKGGLTFREVATLQQTSVSTVHGRYRYGLKKLRSLLNGELEP